jgi:hypothetical protein
MTTVDTLYQFSLEYLNAVEAALTYTVGGVPDVSFVSPGLPAFDCPEQLTVHAATLNMLATTPQDLGAYRRVAPGRFVNMVTLVAIIIRCQPEPNGITNLPAPADISLAAQKTQQDVWAIWNYLKSRQKTGDLFEGSCMPFAMNPPAPQSPQGGSAGWAFQIEVEIGGFDMQLASP